MICLPEWRPLDAPTQHACTTASLAACTSRQPPAASRQPPAAKTDFDRFSKFADQRNSSWIDS
jgi:hypothetical protein